MISSLSTHGFGGYLYNIGEGIGWDSCLVTMKYFQCYRSLWHQPICRHRSSIDIAIQSTANLQQTTASLSIANDIRGQFNVSLSNQLAVASRASSIDVSIIDFNIHCVYLLLPQLTITRLTVMNISEHFLSTITRVIPLRKGWQLLPISWHPGASKPRPLRGSLEDSMLASCQPQGHINVEVNG